MKYVKIELADQTYEKLEQYHAKYIAERKLAAEDYEQRGDFDLSESLAKDFSLEEMLTVVLTRFADEKMP